jgi:pseudouridine kinase
MAEQIPENPYVVVIGAAGIDSKGRAARPLTNHTSTPGTVRVTVGGVARNVADNLARLGIEAVLLSAIGNDGSGRRICNNAVDAGINIDYLITSPNHHTAAYLVILDETGNQVMSVDDMGIMECITPSQINQRRELIQNASMIVLDSNLSQETIASIFKIANRYKIPVCADPTSASLTRKLIPHLTTIAMITPNVTEAETLTRLSINNEDEALIAARKLVNMGVKIAIITLAEMGVVYATANASGHIPAVSTQLVDATGASDALTATVVFGLLNNIPLDEAVRLGAGAAALTLDCTDTVRQDLSLDLLYDQLLI